MDIHREQPAEPAGGPPGGNRSARPPDFPHLVALAVLFEGGLVLLALGLGWLCGFWPLQTFPTSWPEIVAGAWIGTAAALPMLLGLLVVNRYPLGPFRQLKQVVQESILPMFRGVSVPEFALISLLAGLGEEVLFRGLLQGGLAEVLNDRLTPAAASGWALVVASLVFGLMHPITRLYAILCFAVGIYLGCLWIATDNLLAPIVTHAVYDFVALVYLTRDSRKRRAGGGENEEDERPARPDS